MRHQSPFAVTRAATSRRWVRCALAAVIVFVVSAGASAQSGSAAFAGFAYSGDAVSIARRFPYTVSICCLDWNVSGTRIYSRIADTSQRSPRRISLSTGPDRQFERT